MVGKRRTLIIPIVIIFLFLTINSALGQTTKDYWRENSSTIWVSLNLQAGVTQNISIFDTNTYAPNGDNVFILFDDFEEGSISGWSGGATRAINTTSMCDACGNYAMTSRTTGGYTSSYPTQTVNQDNITYSFRVRLTNNADNYLGVHMGNGTHEGVVYSHNSNPSLDDEFIIDDGAGVDYNWTSTVGEWYKFDYHFINKEHYQVVYNNAQTYNFTNPPTLTDLQGILFLQGTLPVNAALTVDNIVYRNFDKSAAITINCAANNCQITSNETLMNYQVPLTTTYTSNVAVTSGSPPPPVNVTSLVAYYSFDNDMNDEIGSNDFANHGTSNTTGYLGNARQCIRSESDYANASGINFGVDFTTTMWVYLDSVPTGTGTESNSYSFQSMGNRQTAGTFEAYQFPHFSYVGGTTYALYGYSWDDSVNAYKGKTYGTLPSTGEWHFYSFVVDGGGTPSVTMYLDGSPVGTDYSGGAYVGVDNWDGPLSICAFYNTLASGWDRFADGRIDELGVWDEALDQTTIENLYLRYEEGYNPITEPCIADWQCTSYGVCQNLVQECINVTDINDCGFSFNGNLSDYNRACKSESDIVQKVDNAINAYIALFFAMIVFSLIVAFVSKSDAMSTNPQLKMVIIGVSVFLLLIMVVIAVSLL